MAYRASGTVAPFRAGGGLLSCWPFSGAEVFEQGVQAGEDAGFPGD